MLKATLVLPLVQTLRLRLFFDQPKLNNKMECDTGEGGLLGETSVLGAGRGIGKCVLRPDQRLLGEIDIYSYSY